MKEAGYFALLLARIENRLHNINTKDRILTAGSVKYYAQIINGADGRKLTGEGKPVATVEKGEQPAK